VIKSVCIFCGSSIGKQSIYQQQAVELGQVLAKRKIKLIYGGASIGIMHAVAQAHLDEQGEVVGIMPQAIIDLEVANHNLENFITTKDMHERKMLMHKMSDAFIALPGGMGTLDELCETITWAQLEYHHKPVFILNSAGYYDHFLAHIRQMHQEGFFSKQHLDLFQVVTSVDELEELLDAAV
jgi:uncharacterized protein (TIGR00730 family)